MATRVGSSRRRCPANAGTAVPTTPAVTTDDSSTAFVTRRMSSPPMSGRPRSRRAIPSHAPEASGRSEIQGTIGRSVSSRPPRCLETRGQTSAYSSLARSTEPLTRVRAPTEPVGHPVDRLPRFGRAGRGGRRRGCLGRLCRHPRSFECTTRQGGTLRAATPAPSTAAAGPNS